MTCRNSDPKVLTSLSQNEVYSETTDFVAQMLVSLFVLSPADVFSRAGIAPRKPYRAHNRVR